MKGKEISTCFINSWPVQVEMCSVRLTTIPRHLYDHILFHLAEMLHLDRDATNYAYLNKSGCSTLAAVDDKEQFNVTIVRVQICSRVIALTHCCIMLCEVV